MYRLAHGTATRKNTSVEQLRTIFRNDELASWVSYKMTELSRSTHRRS